MTSAGEPGKTVADLSHPLADFRHDFGGPRHLQRFLASAASADLYGLAGWKVPGICERVRAHSWQRVGGAVFGRRLE
jgi:hypothetical protein